MGNVDRFHSVRPQGNVCNTEGEDEEMADEGRKENHEGVHVRQGGKAENEGMEKGEEHQQKKFDEERKGRWTHVIGSILESRKVSIPQQEKNIHK